MAWKTLLLAAGMAIPFGQPAPEPVKPADLRQYDLRFEFVEGEGGYDLNAVVIDMTSGAVDVVPIARCATIDIEAFSESLFGTPVTCDGQSYVFDVTGLDLVVSGTQAPRAIKSFAPGHAVFNGIPILMEATGR